MTTENGADMLFLIAWIVWIAAFGVIEGLAIWDDHRAGKGSSAGTLSYYFRLWFRTNTKTGRMVWGGIAGVFFGLFILHIAGSGLTWW